MGKLDRPNPHRQSLIVRKSQVGNRSAGDTRQAPKDSRSDSRSAQATSSAGSSAGQSNSTGAVPSDRVIIREQEEVAEQTVDPPTEQRYPLHHLSVRVPWHDNGWNGTVCQAPELNGACTQINRIGQEKRDEVEVRIAGRRINELPEEQRPYCIHENSAFMSPFALDRIQTHFSGTKQGFLPTEQAFPPFTLSVKPFRWLKRDRLDRLKRELGLDLDINRELDSASPSTWIRDAKNLKQVLSGFAAHLQHNVSLCFMYAPQVPFFEGTNRVLIGVGKVVERYGLTEFNRAGEGTKSFISDTPIKHSIRSDPEESDGFLMPYHEIACRAEEDPSIDMEQYKAVVSPDHSDQFSYGSELVTNDGAIAALLEMENALERIARDFSINTSAERQWLRDELARLGKLRGPYPGLGAVLVAFGVQNGLQVAFEVLRQTGEGSDPWAKTDEAFNNPEILPQELRRDISQLKAAWNSLTDERREFLKLLSRFELSEYQARELYNFRRILEDAEILKNPYLIYEIGHGDKDGIPLLTVDRGVIPSEVSLDNIKPIEGFESPVNQKRVKAFTIKALEDAADEGHTLQLIDDLVERIHKMPVHRKCAVTSEIIGSLDIAPDAVTIETRRGTALQLMRYQKFGEVVRKNVHGSAEVNSTHETSHSYELDWEGLLEEEFGPAQDEEEIRARQEKAAALAEIAVSQFSVLVGSAGTGKTSLLGILCAQEEIREEGILLLAPTGKARVRMQELALGTEAAKTVAEFLIGSGRFVPGSFRYQMSDSPKVTYGTVIVDEASMLTEDMLGALFDALRDVKRFILVGDPSQLPPIGAGRPFVDIVAELRPQNCETRFPRVASGYAELTIERRQVTGSEEAKKLARWFSSTSSEPVDDTIFATVGAGTDSLRFVEWDNPEDFKSKFIEVLVEELKLKNSEDKEGFHRLAMGATPSEGDFDFDLFNPTEGDQLGAVKKVEEWQVLSPLRGMSFGVGDINRQIHNQFHDDFVELASGNPWERPIPKPEGSEQIVYGDKVINFVNNRVLDVFPTEGAQQRIANGEIGVVVGQLKEEDAPPNTIQVEFSSQQGHVYDLGTNGEQVTLELAYALTVHKAQGSQFDLVILVLPKGHRIMSRELMYTALTRHRKRVVVLHQGSLQNLIELANPDRSEIALRHTNLFGIAKV